MAKSNCIDLLRTSYWATRLLQRTKLSPDRLEEEIAKLADPGGVFSGPTGRFRRYAKGIRGASHMPERSHKASVLLLAERLVPNSVWDFGNPLFDLLDEVLYWRKPHLASVRFAKRVQSEILAALLTRSDTEPEVSARAGSIAASKGAVAPTFNRLKRIRRALLAIERFPIEGFFKRNIQSPPGYARNLSASSKEAEAVCFPPTLRDLAIALGMHLEAAELLDPERVAVTTSLLLTALPALRADEALGPHAEKVCRLILKEVIDTDDLVISIRHTRIARTFAPMSDEELLNNSVVVRAVAAHCFGLYDPSDWSRLSSPGSCTEVVATFPGARTRLRLRPL